MRYLGPVAYRRKEDTKAISPNKIQHIAAIA